MSDLCEHWQEHTDVFIPHTKAGLDALPPVHIRDVQMHLLYRLDLVEENIRAYVIAGDLGWYRVGFDSLEQMRLVKSLSEIPKN